MSDELRRRQWIGVEEMNRVLAAEILQRSKSTPSHTSHNQGGWRSHDDVAIWPLPEITRLREMIATAAEGSRLLRAWAVVNKTGTWHRRHIHSAKRSGIYYVTDGGAPTAATLFELRPEIKIAPEPGLMLIFPGATWHSTEPHFGPRERITIAFDLA